ncbi:hypothetical protein GCM10010912_28510 [Paenibacillus albidus]|uniref:Uncharacterized protein n=1 Tax=Paenibacillus albidus TaxID=2041023 RepID=A0A917CCE6_9BACL|nr:hypothetical protein GCM10010912_28510 [Paenibacillus albidus]
MAPKTAARIVFFSSCLISPSRPKVISISNDGKYSCPMYKYRLVKPVKLQRIFDNIKEIAALHRVNRPEFCIFTYVFGSSSKKKALPSA